MFSDLLIHTVEVRARDGQVDRFGQPREPRAGDSPTATYVGRLTTGSPRERFNERERDVIASSHKLFLELGADVKEADRVTVRDSAGSVLVSMANVTGVSRPSGFSGPHHIEVTLDAERSGERG